MDSLMDNKTWELSELPQDRKAIGCKLTFKIKKGANGQIMRYKSRLVAQGFSQKYGEDYDEIFRSGGETYDNSNITGNSWKRKIEGSALRRKNCTPQMVT